MPTYNWMAITRENVLEAIRIFIAEHPEFPEPRNTFLVYGEKRLPAKHIRGMAYKVAFGKEIAKSEYSGGAETVKFFKRLGFDVVYQGSTIATSSETNKVKSQKVKRKSKAKKPKQDTAKIRIPTKGIIEQKNALQLLLNKHFAGDVVCEKTFPWLKTPTAISGDYIAIYNALHDINGDTAFAKKNVILRCDFVCESCKTIIEYDERQHFSLAREVALKAYPSDLQLCYDKELWCKACSDIRAKDGNPVNRDEVRAFYDSTRDIEAAEHGYKLIRIMHGQFDWTSPEAEQYLKQLLCPCKAALESASNSEDNIRIGLYLQTETAYDNQSFQFAMKCAEQADFDILVFPENCYYPEVDHAQGLDISNVEDHKQMDEYVLNLSQRVKKAVILSTRDYYGTLYSIYANAAAEDGETLTAIYVKHTMTDASAFEFDDYREIVKDMFTPILYKGRKIGLTICYDCNHAIFSRLWGQQGVDIIINSTGGDVVYDKWYKYNKARAIENQCYNFVTMGGTGQAKKPHSYVYGFNRKGKELPFHNIMEATQENNTINTIYVYDTKDDDGEASVETSINQRPTLNKISHYSLPVGRMADVLSEAVKLNSHLYVQPENNDTIVFCVIDGEDILKPEKVLPLIYDKRLKVIANKKYILVNRFHHLNDAFYRTILSVILKVRAMENFCAVILESDTENHCYQCGNNRTAQLVQPEQGMYNIDLARTGGPEVIWKNKSGMRAEWRENFEWLVAQMENQ